jgi:hypothetical protein
MTARDERLRLIDDLPAEEQAELVARLKTRMHTHAELWVGPDSSHETTQEPEPAASARWDTIGPAAFGAAMLVGFAAGSVGGHVGPMLSALGALVGLLIGSVVDHRLASLEP